MIIHSSNQNIRQIDSVSRSRRTMKGERGIGESKSERNFHKRRQWRQEMKGRRYTLTETRFTGYFSSKYALVFP